MALYAIDDDDLIYAGEADPGKIYWCADCFGPVKRRSGKYRFPHFYHLKLSRQCRLYSKTEDHMLVQVQLQKAFSEGTIQIERPFLKINRVADACWENEKIVFEVQCSPISEKEVELRENDYKSLGYEIVWLLDDKRYNRRLIRPAEELLRRRNAYYVSIRQGWNSEYYDQFEIFNEGRRLKSGKRMRIDLGKICKRPERVFSKEIFPQQIIQLECVRYFVGDRMYRALQNHILSMQYWRGLEIQFKKKIRKPSKFRLWLTRYIGKPYLSLIQKIIIKLH